MTVKRGPVTMRPASPAKPIEAIVAPLAEMTVRLHRAIQRRHGDAKSTLYRYRGKAEDTQ